MSVDYERVKSLFFEASDLETADVPAFLDAECGGDDALRAEVLSLLGHHDERALIAPQSAPNRPAATLPEPVDTTADDLPGAPVPDPRYRSLEELGRGGFGRVERSFDTTLRRLMARKESLHDDAIPNEMLLNEARLLAYLDHPGAVQVYDVHAGDRVAYTMRLLSGQSLAERLQTLRADKQHLPLSEAIRILTRLAETLANAHDKGVLHLDIKPANVMLGPHGQVALIDWGISKIYAPSRYAAWLRAGGESEHALPGSSSVAGTPVYMPPEQFRGDPTLLVPGSDIYAAGGLLFEMLTGATPFPRRMPASVLALHKQSAPAPSARALRPDVSDGLDALCRRMLAPDPQDRPASFDAVLADLAALVDVGANVETITLADGEVLFREGDAGTTAFQILEGQLAISLDGDHIAIREPGDIIGELALLSGGARSATVTAEGRAVMRALDWPAVERELEKVNPLIATLLRSLSDKLVEATLG